jgi:flagellar biosynthetic protein FlhB
LAETPDRDEKTEAPTEQRRRKAREEGNLLSSRELGPALAGLCGALWLMVLGGDMGRRLLSMIQAGLALSPESLRSFAPIETLLALLAPLLGGLALLALLLWAATIAGRALVGGLHLSPGLLMPKASRLDPLAGLRRMFGPKGLIELLKALAKAALLVGLGAFLLWRDLPTLLGLSAMGLEAGAGILSARAVNLALALTSGLVLIAAGDLPLQFLRWLSDLRMTRQEVKDEMKQTEGSPEARAAVRRMQRALLKRANRDAVAEASVVLVNPTHFAVALRYRLGIDAAPVIVARGRGPVAAVIRELAVELGVECLAYPEVARALYFSGRVGQSIRTDLYLVVATILAFVMQLREGRAEPFDQPEVEVPEGWRFDAEGKRLPPRV